MALSYIGRGASLSAARWNALIEDLDNALVALYSGKSPYAFGAQNELLTGIEFLFGNPSKRKILAGDTREYTHSIFLSIASKLTLTGTDDGTREWTFTDPTQAQYEAVAPMFGLGASFKTDCELEDVWLFDFCLEVMRAEYAFSGADLGWLRKYSQGRNPASLAPSEQLHDRAVAEIIVEGWDSSVMNWPNTHGKFGCLRFHNLDRRELTVVFPDGTRIEIPQLGCKVVRQLGAQEGRRTSWDTRGTYLWRFRSGDAPIWRADRNRARGVWGCSGYSSLDSIAVLHDWIDAPAGRFHFDPRVRWDGSSHYAATFGTLSDSDVVAKYALHGGTYRSLKLMPSGEWESTVGTISWSGNALIATDLVPEIDGSVLAWKSKHDGTHDVVALTTNMLPEGAANVPADGLSVEASADNPPVYERLDASQFGSSTRYYTTTGEPIDLDLSLPTAGRVTLTVAGGTAFSRTLEKCKELKVAGTESPNSSVSTFTDRSLTFDGLTLRMSWSRTTPLTHLLDARDGGPITSNFAEWDLADEWTFHAGFTLATAADDYALMPGRVDRFDDFGPGYLRGDNWAFSRHPDFQRGDSDHAADWTWDAPESTKPGIRYHGQAPTQIATRNSPVIPARTNWIRAATSSDSTEWWVENRDAMLAGEINAEDRRRIWRMPGAVEHYNHLAARLNALKAVSPYQFTDLTYYGLPFASVDVLNNGGASRPHRFGARLDQDSDARARAVELGMRILTAANVPSFAELLAFDSTDWLGPGSTWLQTALPLVGFPASNVVPTYEWTTVDELARAAERLGVPYWFESMSIPQRLGLYQSEGLGPGLDSAWWSTSNFTALWDTASDWDFYRTLETKASVALSEWTKPITYPDTFSENQDYIQAQFPQGDGSDAFVQYPNGASPARAVVVQRASYFPAAPSGWTFESRSRLLIQPMPHFRYAGTTDDRFGLFYVPIAAQSAPPQNPAAVEIDTVTPTNSTRILTHADSKSLLDSVNPPSGSWGSRTMCYVTLIPRVAVWRG